MRALLLLALLPLAACTATTTSNYLEVHGSLADGTGFDQRIPANVALVTSLMPQLGTVMAVGAALSGPEDLRGFRLEWVQTQISEGASFPSSINGPVVFYVVSARPDAGSLDTESSVVNGGTITFTNDRRTTNGTLSNLVLSRNGQTLVTVTSGSFQATKL